MRDKIIEVINDKCVSMDDGAEDLADAILEVVEAHTFVTTDQIEASGYIKADSIKICRQCLSTGEVWVEPDNVIEECDICKGKGWVSNG